MHIQEIIKREHARMAKIADEKAKVNKSLALVNGNPRELITTIGTRLLMQRNLGKLTSKNPYVIDDNNRQSINDLVNYLLRSGRFANQPLKGLLIRGEVGTGKTLLMEIVKTIFFYNNNKIVNLIPAIELADGYQRSDLQIIDRATRGIVCFDDMGQETVSVKSFGSVHFPMIETLTHRYIHHRLTFVTTNLTPADIEKRYGNRIRDRMREMMHEIVLTGKSRRH